jgi:hypothetical protein
VVLARIVVPVCCAAIVACGGSSNTSTVPAAQRVCGSARTAASRVLGGQVSLRIADSSPVNVECLLSGRRLVFDVTAAAQALAWTYFDTFTVHQTQAFGTGPVHVPGQLPHYQDDVGPEIQAAWFPARAELVATNGTESSGGSYLTVVVTGANSDGPIALSAAKAVAKATLAVAPRGPKP